MLRGAAAQPTGARRTYSRIATDELDLGRIPGCVAHFDASTIPETTSTALGTWYDIVGGHDATEATNKPVLVNAPYKLGPELITNGTFDADSDWSKGTGWDINSTTAGKAHHATGSTSNLSQSISLEAGSSYWVSFEMDNRTAGTVTPQFSGGTPVNGTALNANGGIGQAMQANSGNNTLNLIGLSTFDGDVDNVSVRKVLETRPALQFDGADDKLRLLSLCGDLTAANSTIIIKYVLLQPSGTDCPIMFRSAVTTQSAFGIQTHSNGDARALHYDVTPTFNAQASWDNSFATLMTPMINVHRNDNDGNFLAAQTFEFNGESHTWQQPDDRQLTAAAALQDTMTDGYIGCAGNVSLFGAYYIYEIAVYNRFLTDAETAYIINSTGFYTG